jgi:hypothetical protein
MTYTSSNKEKRIKKFWSYAQPSTTNFYAGSPCLEWMLGKSINGYGNFWWEGRGWFAHRFAWELKNGHIPKNLCVLHHCDNRICIEVTHLFIGTQNENIQDKVNKNRQAQQKGEAHGGAKLTNAKVLAIRKLYATGRFTQQELAYKFGLTDQSRISYIVNKKQWQHI